MLEEECKFSLSLKVILLLQWMSMFYQIPSHDIEVDLDTEFP